MKKIFIGITIVILFPYLTVSLFVKDSSNKIKFIFNENEKVRVMQTNSNKIIEVPLEEYVMGVVAGEMPLSFEIEALKAQAVAARSYVLKKMEQNHNRDYDVVDTVMNQVYLDSETLKNIWKDSYDEKITKIRSVVNNTKGEYLTYNGEVIEAFFFSTSTGYTENCEDVFMQALPYLRSVDSHYDEISPIYEVKEYFSLEEFYLALNLPYQNEIILEPLEVTVTGRIKSLKINNEYFSAGDIVDKLRLRSNYFIITQNGDNVIVTTKGYGHGVGMSQYGANGMAMEGFTYDQILKHYYTGVEISKI